MNTMTPAVIAADLHRIADMLATVTGAMPDCYVHLTLQPRTSSDDESIRVIDAIGQAVAGKDGISEVMANGSYHYDVSADVGAVQVAVYKRIEAPAERERRGEVERLRAELTAIRDELERAAAKRSPRSGPSRSVINLSEDVHDY